MTPHAKSWIKGWRLVVLLFFLVGIAIGAAAWQLFSNKLTFSSSNSAVTIQTLWLGEYYTPVSQLAIYDGASGIELVRFDAKSDNARMHTVTVHAGTNEFQDGYLEDYSVSYLAGQPYFFKTGASYKVVAHWKFLSRRRTFVMP